MVFYIIMGIYLVTFLMNKFTNTMIRTYFGFIQMPIIDTKHASKYLCNETLTWMIDI